MEATLENPVHLGVQEVQEVHPDYPDIPELLERRDSAETQDLTDFSLDHQTQAVVKDVKV